MFENKGIVFTKKNFEHRNTLVGDPEKYKNKRLVVVDIAVDNSGYLVLNLDKTSIGDIDKRDTHWFIPQETLKDCHSIFQDLNFGGV